MSEKFEGNLPPQEQENETDKEYEKFKGLIELFPGVELFDLAYAVEMIVKDPNYAIYKSKMELILGKLEKAYQLRMRIDNKEIK